MQSTNKTINILLTSKNSNKNNQKSCLNVFQMEWTSEKEKNDSK